MKIVVAPDSFKGSLSASEVAECIGAGGIRKADPEIIIRTIPIADGGEGGTVETMLKAAGGGIIEVVVTGPLGVRLNSFFGVLKDSSTAVIEIAAAAGGLGGWFPMTRGIRCLPLPTGGWESSFWKP